VYSLVPYEGVADTRSKNRRLGLGLMGIYEWLVKRGYRYEPNEELASWLDEYAKSTDIAARYADRIGVSRPIKTRAIAPTGTIGILAETTTGIEPLFAAAYKRRYLKGQTWHYQYVVDASAKRLIDQGVDPANMESAYELANDPERRIAFQAWVQTWVDHGISSTLNLPAVDQQSFTHAEFGSMLIKYLPHLRGVTAYPDGARGGQPLNVVPLEEALAFEGYEYEEVGNENACVGGSCGI
jgi:ribonucleoside-diphosphate reductase alpha chain